MRYSVVVSIYFVVAFSSGTTLSAGESMSVKEQKMLIRVDKLLREGAAFLRKKDYPAALARFKKAKTKVPDDDYAPVYFWLGLVYADLRDYSAAVAHAQKAAVINPRYAEAWMLWGQSLMHLKKWDQAKLKLDRANRLYGETNNPQYYLVLFNLGRYYYHGKQSRAAALKHFREVIKLNPNYWPAQLYIGYCLLAHDLPGPAAKAFKEVLRRQHNSKSVLLALGYAYRRSGKALAAEKIFLRIVEHDPTYYQAHLQLCHLYLTEIPNTSRAISHYKAFMKTAPANHPWRAILKRYMEKRAAKKSSTSKVR